MKAFVLMDQPVERLDMDQVQVTLKPNWIAPTLLRISLAAISPAPAVAVERNGLVLHGKPEWVHQALRLAARLEMEGYQLSKQKESPR